MGKKRKEKKELLLSSNEFIIFAINIREWKLSESVNLSISDSQNTSIFLPNSTRILYEFQWVGNIQCGKKNKNKNKNRLYLNLTTSHAHYTSMERLSGIDTFSPFQFPDALYAFQFYCSKFLHEYHGNFYLVEVNELMKVCYCKKKAIIFMINFWVLKII